MPRQRLRLRLRQRFLLAIHRLPLVVRYWAGFVALYAPLRFWHNQALCHENPLGSFVVPGGCGVTLIADSPALTPVLPGTRPDGTVLLPNLWSLRPAGQQIDMEDFPVNIAVHPKGRFAAVLHSGYGKHAIVVVDLTTLQIASRAGSRRKLLRSGILRRRGATVLQRCRGGSDSLLPFRPRAPERSPANPPAQCQRALCSGGLAVGRNTNALYVAELWGHRVSEVDLKRGTNAWDLPLKASTNSVRSARHSFLGSRPGRGRQDEMKPCWTRPKPTIRFPTPADWTNAGSGFM